jgi:hypothetical protein
LLSSFPTQPFPTFPEPDSINLTQLAENTPQNRQKQAILPCFHFFLKYFIA